MIDRFILPYIGMIKLGRLNAMDLVAWMGALRRLNVTDGLRRKSHTVLRNALNSAVKLQLITNNPCGAIDPPKTRKPEIKWLELNECERLVEVCKGHRLGDAVILAAITGMRRGEIPGLKWSAVNLSETLLTVREIVDERPGVFIRLKPPKTECSRRVMMLGDLAIEVLRRRREKVIAENMPPREVQPVFPHRQGTQCRGRSFYHCVFIRLRDAAGISENFTFHGLRHTQASLMVAPVSP